MSNRKHYSNRISNPQEHNLRGYGCSQCVPPGVTRCSTCHHFTIYNSRAFYSDESDEDMASESTSPSPSMEEDHWKPATTFVETKSKSRKEELDAVRIQMQDLKDKEEDLLAAMSRRQKRDKVAPGKNVPDHIKTEPVRTTRKKKIAKSSNGLGLDCIGGAHRGDHFSLNGTVVIGSNPVTRNKSHLTHTVDTDGSISPNHVKLVLVSSSSKKNPVLTIKVTDLKSESGTRVNNKMIPKGSSRQAFVRDTIQVGTHIFRVSKH